MVSLGTGLERGARNVQYWTLRGGMVMIRGAHHCILAEAMDGTGLSSLNKYCRVLWSENTMNLLPSRYWWYFFTPNTMASPSFSIWEYFLSAGASEWEVSGKHKQYASLIHLPSSVIKQPQARMEMHHKRGPATYLGHSVQVRFPISVVTLLY